MHLSSFCHPWKVIFTIKIMHDNLFIHSECTGQELVFHIQRQTYITFKHKYHKYLRCFLKDLITLSIFQTACQTGVKLWVLYCGKTFLLTNRERLLRLPKQGRDSSQWGNKKPNGKLPKPQHYFILEWLARTAGVLVPQRPGAEIKTKTLLPTGETPRPSTWSLPVNLWKPNSR